MFVVRVQSHEGTDNRIYGPFTSVDAAKELREAIVKRWQYLDAEVLAVEPRTLERVETFFGPSDDV